MRPHMDGRCQPIGIKYSQKYGNALEWNQLDTDQRVFVKFVTSGAEVEGDLTHVCYWEAIVCLIQTKHVAFILVKWKEFLDWVGDPDASTVFLYEKDLITSGPMVYSMYDISGTCKNVIMAAGSEAMGKKIVDAEGLLVRKAAFCYEIWPDEEYRKKVYQQEIEKLKKLEEEGAEVFVDWREWTEEKQEQMWNMVLPEERDNPPMPWNSSLWEMTNEESDQFEKVWTVDAMFFFGLLLFVF